MLSDVELYHRARAEEGESFPVEVADRIIVGQNPVLVYRNYRSMTRAQLATAAGVDADYLSMIESGECAGSDKDLTALAHALNIDLDVLI